MKNKLDGKKKIILDVAGKLFYSQGFKQTTIKDIAEMASVPQSLVTYYYKKNELLSELYLNLFIDISNEIKKQANHLIINSLQRHIILTNIFYSIILSDHQYKNLYREVLTNDLIPEKTHKLIRTSMRSIIKEFDINISEGKFSNLEIAEYGARKELFNQNFDKMSINSKGLINFFATITASLAGIESPIIDENIKYANFVSNKIDISSIRFLS